MFKKKRSQVYRGQLFQRSRTVIGEGAISEFGKYCLQTKVLISDVFIENRL